MGHVTAATFSDVGALPTLPSRLIRLALRDLRQCEGDARYVIDMGRFHGVFEGRCYVCFAGAVMAGTLRQDPSSKLSPHSFLEPSTRSALLALNAIRLGHINHMLRNMEIGGYDIADADVAKYHTDPCRFHADMETIAAGFEAVGL